MDIRERIAQANQQAVACIIDSDPYWVDIRPAGECVEGLEDHMILHSGPPVDYDDMVMLHKRGMVSAMLFEGWAKDEKEPWRSSVPAKSASTPRSTTTPSGQERASLPSPWQ